MADPKALDFIRFYDNAYDDIYWIIGNYYWMGWI
jgi:hypothetical protein